MSYVIEHEKWLKSHLAKRSGQRLDALKRGHGFGNQIFLEKAWWELYGNFDGLHPEYEILDWRGYPFYADFMWSNGSVKFVIEVQDFSSHVQNMDRDGYRRELNRGLFMKSLQFNLVYIPLDEMKSNSKLVLSLLQNILSPFVSASARKVSMYSKIEKDLMQHAIQHNRILRPNDAANRLELDPRTIIKSIKQLVDKQKFRAIASGKSGRINRYEYIGSFTDPDLY
jgi:hypothetical protein